ncbi:hypothetical protein K9M47_01975 [Candidatus Gracilibacteria bacterium]|nr:hypothetical protein [Candidatus Gracilibacteria bacterium]
MTFIIAMVVIFFSYSVFKPLLEGIFFKIRILFSSKTRRVLKDLGTNVSTNGTAIHLTMLIVLVLFLLSIIYFFFSRYGFGYSISALVGCSVALIEVLSFKVSTFLTNKVTK